MSSHSLLPDPPLLVPSQSISLPLSLLTLTVDDDLRTRRVLPQRAVYPQPRFSDDRGNLFFQQHSHRSSSPGWIRRRPDGGRYSATHGISDSRLCTLTCSPTAFPCIPSNLNTRGGTKSIADGCMRRWPSKVRALTFDAQYWREQGDAFSARLSRRF